MLIHALALQVVLEFGCDERPVRFAAPLPVRAVAQGLALHGNGQLQCRRLPLPERDGRCWVEVTVVGAGPRAVVRTVRSAAAKDMRAPTNGDRGAASAGGKATAAAVAAVTVHDDDGGRTTEWQFVDGAIDRRTRTIYALPTDVDGEHYEVGEARTVETPGLADRCAAAARLPRAVWEGAGLLPPDQGLARNLRPWLQQVAHALVELPGVRGAGDFARSGGVVTNLEFDTTFALLRLALAMHDETLLLRARRGARHLVDRDLSPDSGLPFVHGPDHRSQPPEPGHAWVRGLLWTAAITADDELLAAGAQLARAIAAAPPQGEGRQVRARDYAWPLGELEAALQFTVDPALARAADRLAQAIAVRWDDRLRTFRFGEGEVGKGVYFERAWLTGGIVLPALAAHLRRRPDRELQEHVDDAARVLAAAVGNGRPGLPTHWRAVAGDTYAEHRGTREPEAYLLLDGLPVLDLRRLLRREPLWQALRETPPLDDPDLATSLTIAARVDWVYR